MKTTPHLRSVAFLVASLAAAAVAMLFADVRRESGLGPPELEPASRVVAGSDHAPAVASSRPGEFETTGRGGPAPAPVRTPGPRRGVRGVVSSSRVRLEDGRSGVDPKSWEAQVYALVPSRARGTTDRIGIAHETAPRTAEGAFELDLPTGSHLVVLQHRVARAGLPAILEAWYAYAEVASSDTALVDLGTHRFAAAPVEGIVRGSRGEPCEDAMVDLSDEAKARGDPLVRGVRLTAATGPDGRFAFSLARADGLDAVCRVSASAGGATARREGVRGGDFVELTLPAGPARADVTFEIAWSPETIFWVYARARRDGFMTHLGRCPPDALVEQRRLLETGAYVVELFRRSGPDADEWARLELDLPEPGPRRVRIDPVFQRARALAGSTRAGARVAWVTRLEDGSTLVRGSTVADGEGRFVLRGVPTVETLLATGSILMPVPPGSEALYEVGELESG
jgi:hypothetical protein